MTESTERVLALAFAAAVTACSSLSDGAGSPDAARPDPLEASSRPLVVTDSTGEPRPVLLVLRLRDATMTVTAAEGTPRFSVARTDGSVVARDLDLDGLRAQHEALWRVYTSGYASRGPYLDARLDRALRSDDASR